MNIEKRKENDEMEYEKMVRNLRAIIKRASFRTVKERREGDRRSGIDRRKNKVSVE